MDDYSYDYGWTITQMVFWPDEATPRACVRPLVRWSVRPSVGPSVCSAFAFRPTRSDICRVYGLVSMRRNICHISCSFELTKLQ